jgi:hypothetical protein
MDYERDVDDQDQGLDYEYECEYEVDEYTELQDHMGGDDWDQGQYDYDPYE